MAVKDIVRRLLGYRLGGSGFTEMNIPPGWGYQKYLQTYGEVGWLFGAVSLIANAVADSEWHLYKQEKEIDTHPLLDLLDYVNPFQTRYQFMVLMTSYLKLVGEAFVVINFNRLRQPGELWLAPPGNMTIVPHPTEYISHYEFCAGAKVLRLEVPEVIHIFSANPANPYRGIGAANAIQLDLDGERYASRYQQRLFYNDGRPGMLLEFPDLPAVDERKRLRDEWNEVHQGWRNAYKTAFLWGGAKANMVSMTAKDMDFANLRGQAKKIILGAYHIPDSLIGASEVGSRARAEADEYIFAKYTLKPVLTQIREAFNEQLVPLFDEGLYLDYVDPVPADVAVVREQNRLDFQAGIITREEARLVNGMDAKAEGVFLLPFTVVETPAKALRALAKGMTEGGKESLWRAWAAKTEGEERKFISVLKELWVAQEYEVLENLKDAKNPGDAMFDIKAAAKEFDDHMRPLLGKVFEAHYDDAITLTKPRNPHKQLNAAAIEWIKKHSLEAAKLINGTTLEELRATLAEGFEAGESIPQLTKRIEAYYGEANKVRSRVVARTETIAASAEGTVKGYQDVGVEKTEFYTALDERTCEECMALHGEEYMVAKASGIIPVHPQCRCVWLPIV